MYLKLMFVTLMVVYSNLLYASDEDLIAFDYKATSQLNNTLEKEKLFKEIEATLPLGFQSVKIEQPFLIDGFFLSTDSGSVVMLKFAYEFPKELENKIIPVRSDYLFHAKTLAGIPYALYFKDFSPAEIQALGFKFKSVPFPKKTSQWRLLDLIVATAHAQDDCAPQDQGFISSWMNHLDKETAQGIKTSWGCVVGVFKGAWEATGGAVVSISEMITSPVQSAKSVWSGANKFWDGIKAFQKDMSGALQKLTIFLESIPPEERIKLECELVSGLGSGALVSYFTVGATAPATLAKITKILDKLSGKYPSLAKANVVANVTSAAVKELSIKLASSDKIRFFKNRKEIPMTEVALTPDKSYVVIVSRGKLVIGEDYLNESGTTARTHLLLESDVHDPGFNYLGRGGAIRIQADGSVDVAGYHFKKYSDGAAKNISDLLKEIVPDLKIRSTPGRLSDLE